VFGAGRGLRRQNLARFDAGWDVSDAAEIQTRLLSIGATDGRNIQALRESLVCSWMFMPVGRPLNIVNLDAKAAW
jgi:hypothetical protein